MEGFVVTKNITTEAGVHEYSTDRECVREEQGGPEARPTGLIKTCGASGIEAEKGGGWKMVSEHATDANGEASPQHATSNVVR